MNKLKERNVKTCDSSRFRKFYNEIKALKQSNINEDIEGIITSKSFLEGFRDYIELREILNSNTIYNTAFNDLCKVFGGNRLSSDDKDYTARNFQYQLYLGAFFEKRGLSVSYKEPDLQINFKNKTISIAVKRVNSIAKINKRIREAEKQIIKSSTEGIIAISLDSIINKDNFSIIGNDSRELFNTTECKLESFLKKNNKKDWYYNRANEVIGIIFTLITPSKIKNKPIYGSAFSAICVPFDSSDDSKFIFMNEFAKIAFN